MNQLLGTHKSLAIIERIFVDYRVHQCSDRLWVSDGRSALDGLLEPVDEGEEAGVLVILSVARLRSVCLVVI